MLDKRSRSNCKFILLKKSKSDTSSQKLNTVHLNFNKTIKPCNTSVPARSQNKPNQNNLDKQQHKVTLENVYSAVNNAVLKTLSTYTKQSIRYRKPVIGNCDNKIVIAVPKQG